MRKLAIVSVLVLGLNCSLISLADAFDENGTNDIGILKALNGADVAIYNDAIRHPGQSGAWPEGIIAIKNMLTWMGLTYEEIDDYDLIWSPQDFAQLYQVMIFPGGYAYWYNYWISLVGKERIRDFVATGGGYFGICAGAYFASDRIVWEGVTYDDGFMYNAYGQLTGYDLDLFSGTGTGPLNGIADWNTVGYNMTTFNFISGNTVLSDYQYNISPSSEDILYFGGPYFSINTGATVEVLATYEYNGKDGLIAFHYGSGKVVLSGPHPEIEEDSERDGISFTTMTRKDEMDDRGSDWELTKRIFVWLSGESSWITDYNGDGTSDIAIFRGSSGLWAIRGITRVYFGGSTDETVPGDYNGDGTTDIGIFRATSGLWAIRSITRVYFGSGNDLPEPGDYDGDGTADIGIFRAASGLWAIKGITRVYFGGSSDSPAPGYYDGDSAKDIGIFRSNSGLWAIRGISRIYFGTTGDKIVPGDYDGDGAWDYGIFRGTSGLWAIRGVTRNYFGSSSDSPVPGDYDGTGSDDIGIFRAGSGLWAVKGLTRTYYGSSGDTPVTR